MREDLRPVHVSGDRNDQRNRGDGSHDKATELISDAVALEELGHGYHFQASFTEAVQDGRKGFCSLNSLRVSSSAVAVVKEDDFPGPQPAKRTR